MAIATSARSEMKGGVRARVSTGTAIFARDAVKTFAPAAAAN